MSSGNAATRASAIVSACRPDVGQRVRGLEAGAVRDGEHAGHAVQDDRQPAQPLLGLAAPGTRPGRRPAPFLARVSRAAAALSWMPRCSAVSAMLSPQTTRSASTICAPGASAGSQATKSRASRSSTTSPLSSNANRGASRSKASRRRCSSIQARFATRTHQAARSSMGSALRGPRRAPSPRRRTPRRRRGCPTTWPGPSPRAATPRGTPPARSLSLRSGRPCATRWCRRWAPGPRSSWRRPRRRSRRRRSR